MKVDILRMYDAVKAIEIEKIKEKLALCGGMDVFETFGNDSFQSCPRICVRIDGALTEVYVLNVSADEEGNIHMEVVKENDSDKGIIIIDDNDAYPYGVLSEVADQICLTRSIGVKIECVVEGSKEQMDVLLRGDKNGDSSRMLSKMFDNGQVFVEGGGEIRIPAEDIECYNLDNGENHDVKDLILPWNVSHIK